MKQNISIKKDFERAETLNRPDNKSILLTPADLKEILGCNNNTLYALLNEKDFPSFKINSRYYICYEDFMVWVRKEIWRFHKS